jgi:hypothetical protein
MYKSPGEIQTAAPPQLSTRARSKQNDLNLNLMKHIRANVCGYTMHMEVKRDQSRMIYNVISKKYTSSKKKPHAPTQLRGTWRREEPDPESE